MSEKVKRVINIAKYESDEDLSEKIWSSLIIRKQKIAKLKLWVFSSVSAISLVGLFPMLKVLVSDFRESGFYEYLSIAFSNSNILGSSWKELTFSLAESVPTISIVLTFAVLFIFFLSFRYAIKQIIKGQLTLISV